ncbi:radical SAM protein [Aestuariivirga sp.]|jgi:radical SAM superfamily enzyme YgiQ (UPF0313 family)|uniref:radical SAM protein n=1 Tax=Aestuariivirga sp. TaxID=2650926 RepID=UPI003782D8B8
MIDKSLYLINPREPWPSYYGTEFLEAWDLGHATGIADLTTPTIAALAPSDWSISICDERVQTVDFDTPAAVVGLTGKVTQRTRIKELADEFRRRGKLVIIGGPYASLNSKDVRDHCDILILGEAEDIAIELFTSIHQGTWKHQYDGGKPDMRKSPIPNWMIYPTDLAMGAQVQTSRGCPFECEFCDVIQYAGRKQRWKDPQQVISELDYLYNCGFRDVLLADDNLTVMRRRATELLIEIEKWNNCRPSGRVRLGTQLSIDITRDADVLQLCRRAGLNKVFIGLETPNSDSLQETNKRQNLKIDLVTAVEKFARLGIMVIAGFIVGFDHDGPDIFDQQAHFIQQLPVPIAQIGMLVAPHSTPLYERLSNEGRLISDGNFTLGNLTSTNILPKLMTLEYQQLGMRWLLNRVYDPLNFAWRVQSFVNLAPPPRNRSATPNIRKLETSIARVLAERGTDERMLVTYLTKIIDSRPELHDHMAYFLINYAQIRHMLEFGGIWDPRLSKMRSVQ